MGESETIFTKQFVNVVVVGDDGSIRKMRGVVGGLAR